MPIAQPSAAPRAYRGYRSDATRPLPPRSVGARRTPAPRKAGRHLSDRRNYIGRPVQAARDLLPNHVNPMRTILMIAVVSVVISAVAGALFGMGAVR